MGALEDFIKTVPITSNIVDLQFWAWILLLQ